MAKNDKKKWIKIGAIALGVVVAAGVVTLLTRDGEKEQKLGVFDYQACRIDDVTGKKVEEDNTGISTKNFIKLEQLQSITLSEKAEAVTYYVNCYDDAKTFIQVDEYTADLTAEDMKAYENLGVTYVKIEVVDSDDDEITSLDVLKVSEMLEVTLTK